MKNSFKIEPKFSKSSREIWDSHFEKLTEAGTIDESSKAGSESLRIPSGKVRFMRHSLYYAAAAVVVLLMVPLLFTRSVSAPSGEHSAWELPDGSVMTLNAESKVSYKPLLWMVSRSVKMTGEVFFKVVKGSSFTVKSDNGSVRVLGTSFNVYSRNSSFSVSCITGKVEVKSTLSQEGSAVKATLAEGEGIKFRKESDPETIPATIVATSHSWIKREFYFTATPLKEVFSEVSRQYGIDIEFTHPEELYYTGNFSATGSPEKVLSIITLPFSLSYEKTGDGYKIVKGRD